MSKRLCFSLIFLSILLSSALLGVHSLSARSQPVQNSMDPQLTLNITDWWNAPVAINSVRIQDQEVSSGSSIVATDDWTRNLSIDATNRSDKTISYIAYAIDFKIAGEENLYRVRLQDGKLADAMKAPNALRVLQGQQHNMKFTDDAWRCQSRLIGMINERKARIVKVELFVESVAFTDDTLWEFGSHLKRITGTSTFENVEHGGIAKSRNNQMSALARSFADTGTSTKLYGGCCVPNMNYTSGGCQAVQVLMECSSCPPSAGGGFCPFPHPFKNTNSCSGQGHDGISMLGFSGC
jgi:hypothetical protein